eukprot:TRINITY_DN7794_c0_g1_i1.p1 TRINITY_DN7794_c0_g1~~TRINITY_DN7794_c0_g1_i1.p1  ORF type:complete len:458 (+),score=93.47 TRINITY_DN7794_c0_g1_i1:61-1434(+)
MFARRTFSRAVPSRLSHVSVPKIRQRPRSSLRFVTTPSTATLKAFFTQTTFFVSRSPLKTHGSIRFYSGDNPKVLVVKVPNMGDSIQEGTISSWAKQVGDHVSTDEVVAEIETDKITVDIRAPQAGAIKHLAAKKGDTVKVGDELFHLDTSQTADTKAAAATSPKSDKPETQKPAAKETQKPAAKETPKPAAKETQKPAVKESETPKPEIPKTQKTPDTTPAPSGPREDRVPMNRMRKRIAVRLKDSQNTTAMLTTFQEVDMHNLSEIRNKYKDIFLEKHGVKLGFMSCFVKAAVAALQEHRIVNAVIDGDDIIYRNYFDLSVAVATPTGLVVPVIRDADKLSFAEVEKTINELGLKARQGKLTIEDMTGGTFTISNGGVYGSLMGTPIINPPQSAILGMHAINRRPVAIGNDIVIRPMMYLALTYDHRLIDGRDAVLFLRKIKSGVEDPVTLLLSL